MSGGVVHALLIGISDYDGVDDGSVGPLGLDQLGSAALTALRMAEWLDGFDGIAGRPLGSLCLLAAPSEVELEAAPELRQCVTACRHADVMRELTCWRANASQDEDDLAFFYFAGHGVQREERDHVLLLQDAGEPGAPMMSKALESTALIDGMAITDQFPQMAQRQLYVFDACRMTLETFQQLKKPQPWPVWDYCNPNDAQRAARTATVLHTATDGSESFGIHGHQSVFSDALLRCLHGSAARENGEHSDGRVRWTISMSSLIAGLAQELQLANLLWETAQTFDSSGIRDDLLLREIDPPPDVEIAISLDPRDAQSSARLELLDDGDDLVWAVPPPVDPHPFCKTVPAG